jgi:hypothetical protein
MSKDTLDGPADFYCQVEGRPRKINTTMGALRRRSVTLRCPAGHENVIDGRKFDRDISRLERASRRRIFK